MSELMDRAVIGMPFDMAMRNHLSRMQFYNRAKAILAERDALLAERDAAFAAGQEEMRERAVAAARKRKVDITDNYACGWTTCAVRILDELQALPINDGPDGR